MVRMQFYNKRHLLTINFIAVAAFTPQNRSIASDGELNFLCRILQEYVNKTFPVFAVGRAEER